jgi:hypothetical protein
MDAASTCITVASLAKPSYGIAILFVCHALVRPVTDLKLYHDVSHPSSWCSYDEEVSEWPIHRCESKRKGMRHVIIVAAPQ